MVMYNSKGQSAVIGAMTLNPGWNDFSQKSSDIPSGMLKDVQTIALEFENNEPTRYTFYIDDLRVIMN